MRVRRGILDVELKDGLFIALKLPGIQWTKHVGNHALGAAFGIILTNELEVEISKQKCKNFLNQIPKIPNNMTYIDFPLRKQT